MPRIAVNGADLYYEDTGGPGEPVVFSHGLLWSGSMFEAQIAALRGRYRCIAFDHRGQGRSAVARDGYDMDNVAADAAALIRALGVAPCHFVGLSMGGFVGLRLAARSPELIRSLVLIDTAADAEPPWNRLKYGVLGVVARVLGMRPVLGETMKAMFGRTFLTDPARASDREELKSRLRANDVAGAVRALGGVSSRASVEDELPAIRCPTLVVTGEEDVSVEPARSERTARAIAAAQLVRIPRAGHSSTLEEPQAVSGAIGAFLDGVSARAGAVQSGSAAGPVNG